jgi:gas vesicle protein
MNNRSYFRNLSYDLQSNLGGIAAGVLIGALAGAITMLFIAPQSGRRMRALVRHKALELRDQATEVAEDAMWKARSKTKHLSHEARTTAKGLQERGQDVIEKQKERVESVLEAGQRAVKGKFR